MVTRITGMASGMDIDSMVKKLMTAEKAPLTKMNQQKQLMEWKRESYRDVSTKMVTFQEKLSELVNSSTLTSKQATVTGNTSAITAIASSSASGAFDVSVTNLASASYAVTQTAGTGKSLTAPLGVAAGNVRVGNATIPVDANETIDSFVKKVNSNKDAGVTAIYDTKNGISFTSKTTGTLKADGTTSNNLVSITDPASTAFGISKSLADAFDLKFVNGVDAKVTINGLQVTKSTNTFDINGVSLTLNAATPSGETTKVNVVDDTDKIVASVKSFVEAYNDVLSSINGKVGEERYKKYTPLSTEERAAMSDDEAKLWTDKAKSGMLKNDSILQDAVASMRTAMVQGVKLADGSTLSMVSLGITTGNYQTKGKLELDTDKLKATLQSNPNAVSDFFNQDYSKAFSNNKYTETDGMLAKMRKISTGSLQRMYDTAGTSRASKDLTASFMNTSVMGEQLTSLDRRISEMTEKLNRIETNYFKKFTAMETSINRYNSQSSSLAGL
ncbi:flagellar filament capping protein FliD [Saccharibacillus endophyticus]|uniref:Flagellar hook-associated protein 2 n=1 Tax=Saccharibacillus endophyticus TaxID=2060666 RepID=A0ABQ2A8Z8_9BACL|nr:flagellar filament capping protein FliD [Saccharibacillus endophyticus]GGH86971.1 flagellar hook-associated protein 2 [Saccharibacillus endophyticus]